MVAPNTVIRGLPSDRIDGGAIRGSNLFHSFQQFNIGEGRGAYFANPAGIENILSRVTGGTRSEILGRLGVLGNANLFLLNPNGIVFGPNSSLDVAGSFTATTANEIALGDQGFFSATQPENSQLLAIAPRALYFDQQTRPVGNIHNAGSLVVGSGSSLTLRGNQITNTGSLIASKGTVRILGDRIGLLENAYIDVSSTTGGGNVFIGGSYQGKGELPNASQPFIGPNVTINANASANGDGGKVVVWADKDTRFSGKISARGGSNSGNGGFVEVSSKQFLVYKGQVDTFAPNGTTGTLLLDPTNVEVVATGADTNSLNDVDQFSDSNLGVNSTKIAADAIGGATANVILQATNNIIFNADVFILGLNVGLTAQAGNDITVNNFIQAAGGGEIRLLAGRNISLTGANAYAWTYGKDAELNAGGVISLLNGAQVDTAPFAGDSGNLTVKAQSVILANGAQLKVAPYAGNGGALTINAPGSVELSGIGSNVAGFGASGLIASSEIPGAEAAGNIVVTTPRLTVRGGAIVGAQTSTNGKGGAITINAPELVEVSGFTPSPDGEYRSGISAATSNTGDAGIITVNAGRLLTQDGGRISAASLSFGKAGTLTVTSSNSIELNGTSADGTPSGLFTNTNGESSDMTIVAKDLTVKNGAKISTASSSIFGNAGNLKIQATGSVLIDNGSIESSSLLVGSGGDTSISAANLSVQNNAKISTTSTYGSSGNLTIDAIDAVSIGNNSSLDAFTFLSGDAGNISITTAKLNVNNSSISTGTTSGDGVGGVINIYAADSIDISKGFISSSTFSETGKGGDVVVRTGNLLLDNASAISSGSIRQGQGGNVRITAGQLTIRNRSEVSVRGISASAIAGNIDIAANSLSLEDQGKIIASSTSANGGNILINVKDLLLLRRNGLISAEAGTREASALINSIAGTPQATGDGGNVTINSPFIIAVPEENSDVTANAFTGRGGRVNIVTQGIFGLQFRPQRTARSDITASSTFGISGVVVITSPDNSFLQNSLAQLSDNLIDPNVLLASSCIVRNREQNGSFLITGSGGLPVRPGDPPPSTFPTGEVRSLPEPQTNQAWKPGDPIAEPQGIYRLANGKLVMSRECEP